MSARQKNNLKTPKSAREKQVAAASTKDTFLRICDNARWPVFVLYAILLISGVTNHESWADEAQSWLIARDADLPTLFKLLPSEGHPPLWYLLLMPFAKAGMPYAAIKWISGTLALCTVYILLFRTRYHPILKMLLPFGYLLFFEYALFGRSYSLIIFFIIAIVSLYPKRFERPWLFALCVVGLFNTHVLVFGFCLGLALLYAVDAFQAKRLKGPVAGASIVMLIGGLYLIPYLAGSSMTKHFETTAIKHAENLQSAITGAMLVEGNFIVSMILFLLLTGALLFRPKAGLLLLMGIGCTLYILTFRYNGTTRHFMVIFAILVGCYGIADNYSRRLISFKPDAVKIGNYILCFTVFLHIPHSIHMYGRDRNEPYTDAENAATFIQNKSGKDAIIVAWQSTSCLATLPYMLERKLYYADCQRFGTYYIYDTCFTKGTWMYPVDYAVKVAHDNFKNQMDKVIFLFDYPIMQQTEQYLDRIYVSEEEPVRWDEKFYIYKFKENVK